MHPDIHFRPLSASDLPQAHGLTQTLRWPHRLADWQQFLGWSQRHGESLGAFADERLIGSVLAWYWGERQANVGLMIIADDWQQRGLGRQLLTRLLQTLGERSVMLQATEAGLPLYRQLGFVARQRCAQFQGTVQTPATQPGAAHTTSTSQASAPRCRPAHAGDWPALCALDAEGRGLDRSWLLQALWQAPRADAPARQGGHAARAAWPALPGCETEACTGRAWRTAVVVDQAGETERLLGYGMLRRFGRGWLLGPMVAADETQAVALCRLLCADLAGQFLRLDLAASPRADGPLLHWLYASGLAQVDQPLSMVRPAPGTGGSAPDTGREAPGAPDAPGSLAPVLALVSQATG